MMPLAGALLARSRRGITLGALLVVLITAIAVTLDPMRVVAVGVVVLAGQFSITLSLHWRDAAEDYEEPETRATPDAATRRMRGWALGLCFASLALSITLGPWVTVVAAAVLAIGWADTRWLGSTPASPLAPAVTFALLPLLVTLALPTPAVPRAWAVGVCALLGVAIHFWPAGGRLPRMLGRRASVAIAVSALAAAAAVAAISGGGLFG